MNSMYNTASKLAGIIDQTLLKPDITKGELDALCEEAIRYGFKTIAVNAANLRYCAERLKGSIVGLDSSVSFPLGQCTLETKLFETANNIECGATEIDYVINIGRLKDRDYDYLEKEMKEIVRICAQSGVISKAIFENCYLTPEEIETMSKIALNVRPDFIKTSTGFAKYGARVEDVRIMKRVVGDAVKVKAAGGIRSLADVNAMIQAGALRIGTSCGPKIIYELSSSSNSSIA